MSPGVIGMIVRQKGVSATIIFCVLCMASANTSITFKVPKVTESGQKQPKVPRSTLSEAKCLLCRSKMVLSTQIWQGNLLRKFERSEVARTFPNVGSPSHKIYTLWVSTEGSNE